MVKVKRLASVRVYLDEDTYSRMRKAARQADASLSSFIGGMVRRDLALQAAAGDRTTVVLEYLSIQVDLLLTNADPQLKKKAREVFKGRKIGATLPLVEAGNAL